MPSFLHPSLASHEFRGAFGVVAFAILEFKDSDSGNVAEFVRALNGKDRAVAGAPLKINVR